MEVFKMLIFCLWCASASEGGFQEDAARLLRRVRMSPERISLASIVWRDLQNVLRTRWPEIELTPYGSVIAGHGVASSDLDFSADIPEFCPHVEEAKSILDQYPHVFQKTRAVPARVPIVKFCHAPTGHFGDLSFGNTNSIRKTEALKYIMNLDNRVLDLTTIVRHWAKLHKPVRSLHGRIMPNTAIASLVTFYLQQVKVLPSIAALQENARGTLIDGWETGFDEIPYRSTNNASLHELLGGFFQYFNKFDFENMVVSTHTANPIRRSAFKKLSMLPESYMLYKRNMEKGFKPINITSPVVISDMFLLNINTAKEMTAEVLEKFKLDLKFAADAYSEERDDFLRVILGHSDILLPDDNSEEQVWINSTCISCCKI